MLWTEPVDKKVDYDVKITASSPCWPKFRLRVYWRWGKSPKKIQHTLCMLARWRHTCNTTQPLMMWLISFASRMVIPREGEASIYLPICVYGNLMFPSPLGVHLWVYLVSFPPLSSHVRAPKIWKHSIHAVCNAITVHRHLRKPSPRETLKSSH